MTDTTKKPTTGDRKQSSADLQSRLKSRKLLGVGATDDGDIHRSKLSQLLGQSDVMMNTSRIPVGIHWWFFFMSVLLLICSFWSLILPGHYNNKLFGGIYASSVLYSTTLFCLALPLTAVSQSYDKNTIQWTAFSMEIMLIMHGTGAFFGQAFNAFLFIALLVLTNTWFIAIMMSDSSRIVLFLRNLCRQNSASDSFVSSPKPAYSSSVDKKSD